MKAVKDLDILMVLKGLPSPLTLPGIGGSAGAAYRTVMFKQLCDLFNQATYIPLRYCPN
jgi:hypothetical protein